MIETRDEEINGSVYTVTQMTARRALKMQARLIKLLGPSISQIFVSANDTSSNADNAIPKAISLLSDQLDEKTFEQLVLDLMQGVRKDGHELRPEIIDMEFAGNLNTLFLVLKFILEVNFSDFFRPGGILGEFFNTKNEIKISQELKTMSKNH